MVLRTDIKTEVLMNLYDAGYSASELSKKFNTTPKMIIDRLKNSGVITRTMNNYNTDRLSRVLSDNQRGENNTNWNNGSSKLFGICECCGKKFVTNKCGRDIVRFCSNKCAHTIMTGFAGFKHSTKTKKIQSKLKKGIKLSNEHIEKVRQSLLGRKRTIKERESLRIGAIKRIERQKLHDEPLIPCIGKYETTILDYLEEIWNYTILRQYRVAGYFVDGYCPMLNLAIEIDETFHNNQIDKDQLRQENIKKRGDSYD